ncbi:alpha/beta hydrolase family protein [Asaia platycodi]|uniref:alpha/beta hydrolase family protein n=1 Tax=Asaia platycodi TaxID=610243 RepID=UPI000472A18B|nr:alpha/beta fold hydrolase [Asaia platycodi]
MIFRRYAYLAFLACQALTPACARTLSGDWRGALLLPQGATLPLVLHMKEKRAGWSASLDSPMQGAFGLAVQDVTLDGKTLTLTLPTLGARYIAQVNGHDNSLEGTWYQGTSYLPLTLIQSAPAPPPIMSRPQIPHPPFPYRSDEVAFDNPAGPAHLTGTLTLPAGKGPFPAVLLITGSGLQDRDETIFGHKPFLVWADTLTRRGIAVLRVDDRQKGGSTGPVSTATTQDFAHDTEAGLTYLQHRKDIDPHRIGLMGHSEGGIIAPMIAQRDQNVAFIVLLAGPATRGRQIILAQQDHAARQQGNSDAAIAAADTAYNGLMDTLSPDQSQADADQAAQAFWARQHPDSPAPPPQLKVLTSPWMRFYDRYDPAPALAKTTCPVLAVIGAKDRQVPPDQTLPALKAALARNSQATISVLPGLNHLFQKANTGDVSEYARIEEDIDPEALSVVGDWIIAQTARRGITP